MPNVEDAVKWAEDIARDNSHGYSQGGREGKDFDCSSLVCRSLKAAGFNAPYPSFSTRSMGSWLESNNWEWHNGVSGVRRGDIMWKTGHTAWASSGSTITEACIDENGNITGGKVGDQTGNEIRITNMNRYNWKGYWRYKGEKPKKNMNDAQIADIPNQTYTGKEIKPAVTSGAGATFDVSYKDNINIGYGTATATGKGDWTGSVSKTFKILPSQLVKFTDVDPTAWYVNTLAKAVEAGYINGYSGTTMIDPYGSLTRGQACCMIANAEGAKLESAFSDVVASPYYYEAVNWAEENEIVNGDGGAFRPDDPCTRQEFCCMLYNLAGNPDPAGEPTRYSDWNSVADWARNAIAWCIEVGVLSGNSGMIRPNDNCQRCEAAALLVNYKNLT